MNPLTPKQMKKAILHCLAIRRVPFIWGAPGIGKSQIVRQLLTESALGSMIDLRASQLESVDFRGVPFLYQEDGQQRTGWALPSFLPTSGKGVIFLDEMNSAERSTQAPMYQLILDHALGDWTMPDGWNVIAAGNREIDRAITEKLSTAMKSRFIHFELKPDFDEWVLHAAKSGYDVRVIAYLRHKGCQKDGALAFHNFDPNSKDNCYPCPRTWEFVSDIIKMDPDPEIELALYQGCVGTGPGADFWAFLQIVRNCPNLQDIIADPDTADVPTDPGVLFATAAGLSMLATPNNIQSIIRYSKRAAPEFGMFLIRGAVARNETIAQTPAYVAWSTENQDWLN